MVKFPKERWRKVNVSKFLRRFKSIKASKIIEVPDDEIDRVIDVLKRNNCSVELIEFVKDDVEIKLLKELLKRVEAIRLGVAEPKELEKLAVDAIAKFSLSNLSDEVSELLHDCIDFAEQPFIGDLNEIDKRAKEILKVKLGLSE